MKVCSFNLRVESEADGINAFHLRHDRVLEFVSEQSPDIIGFQELNGGMRAWLEDAIAPLGYTLLGCGRNADYSGESMGIAFLRKKFQLVEVQNRWLSATPVVPGSSFGGDQSVCPRMFTAAVLKPENGSCFLFLNTHLDHRGPNARYLGAMQIVQYLSEKRLPFIVTGDMNALPETRDVAPFTSYQPTGKPVADVTADVGPTFHKFGQIEPENRHRIDYIFTDLPYENARTVHPEPINGVYLSDHDPVIANILLEETK